MDHEYNIYLLPLFFYIDNMGITKTKSPNITYKNGGKSCSVFLPEYGTSFALL